MPYITTEEKLDLTSTMEPVTPGQLTYTVTVLVNRFVKAQGRIRFVTLCLVMGALMCAAFEFYRRVVVKYEDEKIRSNGDVYPENPGVEDRKP